MQIDIDVAKNRIAKRIAMEIEEGQLVNLGIGLPSLVANYVPEGIFVQFQGENGMIGMGPMPLTEDANYDITNAGGACVKVLPGGCFFDSSFSFALIRGGHVGITVLGALEVDQHGNLANWIIPGKKVPGMGGAMDLVVGAKKVIVATLHTEKGKSKILKECKLPLTAKNEVNLIVTECAVMEVTDGGLVLREIAPDVTVEDVIANTEAELIIDPNMKVMAV